MMINLKIRKADIKLYQDKKKFINHPPAHVGEMYLIIRKKQLAGNLNAMMAARAQSKVERNHLPAGATCTATAIYTCRYYTHAQLLHHYYCL